MHHTLLQATQRLHVIWLSIVLSEMPQFENVLLFSLSRSVPSIPPPLSLSLSQIVFARMSRLSDEVMTLDLGTLIYIPHLFE